MASKAAKKPAPATSPEPGHDITPIPLNLLSLSPLNVRRVSTDVTDLETNIAANGLLQSLVVVPSVKGALITNDGNLPMYDVVCGGRRLQALTNLWHADRLPKNFPVPCRIVTDEQAVALSLAENQQREPMHPVDEAVAFADLLAAKTKKKTIATLYGVTPRYIDQRVKLAGVAPELLEEARAGKLPLVVLEAFTVTDDHDKQRAALAVALEDGPIDDDCAEDVAALVREELLTEVIETSNRLVKFVGLDAYREAGGTFVNDLFSDEDEPTLLSDGALLKKLAEKKLRKHLKPLQAEGWKWLDVSLTDEVDFREIYVNDREPTEAEVSEREALLAEAVALEGKAADSAEDRARIIAINRRLEELDEGLADFEDWHKQLAGALVSLTWLGTPTITRGLLREEDEAEYDRQRKERMASVKGNTTTNTTTASDGAGGEPKNPPAPGRKSDDIRFADLCADVLRIRSGIIEQIDELAAWSSETDGSKLQFIIAELRLRVAKLREITEGY